MTFSWDWEALCGRGTTNITVWEDGDFGHCFEQLVFGCTTHILLAITSAYYISFKSHLSVEGPIPRCWSLHGRFLLTILLSLAPIIFAVATYFHSTFHLSLVDIITACIQAFSWLIHSGLIWKLKRHYHIHIRGPPLVLLSFLLTLVSQAIKLRTIILHIIHHSSYLNIIEEYVSFTCGVLHLAYTITLIPSKRPALPEQQMRNILSVNDDSTERDSLLDAERTHYYGSRDGYRDENLDLGIAEDETNIFSKSIFWWVNPLMKKGAKQKLHSTEDFFVLPSRLQTQNIEEIFTNIFIKHRRKHNKETIDTQITDIPEVSVIQRQGRSSSIEEEVNHDTHLVNKEPRSDNKDISLLLALHKAFGCEYFSLGILRLISDGLTFMGPILLNWLVSYMENKNEPIQNGYYYALGLFLSTLLAAFFSLHFNYQITCVGFKIRASIITCIYRKALAVNTVSLSKFNMGEVINFMSTDTDRIVNFCPSFHQFWSLPFQIAVALYLLHQQVGLAFLAGLGFAILLIPINRWIAIKIGQLSKDMMERKDARVKVMNEILYGIRVIKFYAWEKHFAKNIIDLRAKELESLKGRKYLDALCVYFWATTPVLISILTFTTYSLMGNQLTAAKVFTSLALFNILLSPLNAFPWVLNGLIEAWVSLKRVQNFVELEELNWMDYYTSPVKEDTTYLDIDHGVFSWRSGSKNNSKNDKEEENSKTPIGTLKLMDIILKVEKGSFVGIIGKVGSGKSSLLNAILAEMKRESGRISAADLEEGFGYAGQEPWIQHDTVRNNILFGKPYNQKKYETVLHACALIEDLKILPGGDRTEIGENGVTLSGGQKARVALARAIYQDKNIYLLDDPLAAVDAHVGRHLFVHCIMGLLKNKTRILCTHHVEFLQEADEVVVMEDGRIVDTGPPGRVLSDLDLESEQRKEEEDESEDVESVTDKTGDCSLTEEEEKDSGSVKLHVYKTYWIAVGTCLAPVVLFSLLLMQASRNITDWWLSYWVTHSHGNNSQSALTDYLHQEIYHHRTSIDVLNSNSTTDWKNITDTATDNIKFYLIVYGSLAGANSVFTFARAFLYAYGGICAAFVIHRDILESILKAPISFFDMTPIGRIINRFSSDIFNIDDGLPFILNIFLAQFFGILGTLAITCYGLPWFALLLLPLGVMYYFIQRYYRHTSRDAKRIYSITLSPIYAHFSETVQGMTTIRAHRETQRFIIENKTRLEANQRASYNTQVASMWLAVRLQAIGITMVTAIAFIAVLEHHFQTVNPGLVGLSISYALSITNLLSGVLQSFTETEKQMVSVERASQYIEDIPQEAEEIVNHAHPFLPLQGMITFKDVCLQYRPNLPLALNEVSFKTKEAEKVGVVGRTGSGKSSLFIALFRMVQLKSGQILIDGLDISRFGLHELRSRLAIIPQDPFLFSGTVQENLDPTGQHGDHDLWTVLERCHLKQAVDRLGGLEAEVGERGRHFSVGQRQLVCLARALLTRAKVLCIDEATASVDKETDGLIQKTIREVFAGNTVITVAHRIDTILDSDRVLVMNEGKVAEFDHPQQLLKNHSSLFYQLVHGNKE